MANCSICKRDIPLNPDIEEAGSFPVCSDHKA